MARVAACLRRGSALGLRPPNVGSGRQGSRTLMALGAQQQPLNCARLRRVGLCDDLADNCRTVVDLPGRTAEMRTETPPLPVKQARLGRFERPFEAAFFGS